MITKDLRKYIKEALKSGMGEEEIEKALVEKGWNINDIKTVLNENKGVEDSRGNFWVPQNSAGNNFENNSENYNQATDNQETQMLGQNKLMPIGDLVSKVFNVFRENLKLFLGVALIPAAVSIAIFLVLFSVAIIFALNNGILNKVDNSLNTENIIDVLGDAEKLGGFFVGFFIFLLVFFIVNTWAQTSLIFAVKDRGKTTIGESLKNGFSKIIPFLFVALLVAFIVGAGWMFFLVPGIIFAVWFFFANYILIYEGKGGVKALIRSKDLVSGNWWDLFGRMIVLTLLMWAISFVVSIATQIFSLFIAVLGIVGIFISIILQMLIQAAITSFSVCFIAVLYEEFKRIKSGIKFEEPDDIRKLKFALPGVLGIILTAFFLFFMFSNLFKSVNSEEFKNYFEKLESSSNSSQDYNNNDLKEKSGEMSDLSRRIDLLAVRSGLEVYYSENGKYPGKHGSDQLDVVILEIKEMSRLEELNNEEKEAMEYWVSEDTQKYILKMNFKADYVKTLDDDIDGYPLGRDSVYCGEEGINDDEYCFGNFNATETREPFSF